MATAVSVSLSTSSTRSLDWRVRAGRSRRPMYDSMTFASDHRQMHASHQTSADMSLHSQDPDSLIKVPSRVQSMQRVAPYEAVQELRRVALSGLCTPRETSLICVALLLRLDSSNYFQVVFINSQTSSSRHDPLVKRAMSIHAKSNSERAEIPLARKRCQKLTSPLVFSTQRPPSSKQAPLPLSLFSLPPLRELSQSPCNSLPLP